jgi:hypothetical protein
VGQQLEHHHRDPETELASTVPTTAIMSVTAAPPGVSSSASEPNARTTARLVTVM